MPTTSSPKPPRDIYDLLGWEVEFTGLTDFPYLNGEPGYAADIVFNKQTGLRV
jgi:hypothetical protein